MDGLLSLGILVLGIILVVWLFQAESRKKKDAWTGVLEDKKINKYYYKGKDRIDYLLFFRNDSGKKITYNATEEIYNTFENGDRAAKRKGEYYPVKLS